MQKYAIRQSRKGPCTVETIAGDGMADARQVCANLMRSSGADAHFEKSESLQTLADTIFGVRFTAVIEPGRHSRAANWIARDGLVDAPGFRGNAALDQGQISFFDGPRRELGGQRTMCGIRARDQKNAAGSPIEAMHDAWTQFPADFRQLREMVHKPVHQCARMRAGAGMNDNPGRLVHRDDGGVLIENLDGQILGCSV
jgi:hypothetical protein